MAITTSQIDDLPDYTDAQIVKMLKAAVVAVSTGQSVTVMGRTVSRANLAELRETLEFFENRVNAAEEGGGTALVQFGERV